MTATALPLIPDPVVSPPLLDLLVHDALRPLCFDGAERGREEVESCAT